MSLIVTSHTTAVVVAAQRRNARHPIISLTIDNDNGGADRTIRIQDKFTPAVSNGVAVPVAQTIERFRIDVLQGDVVNLSEQDLKGVECLGSINVLGDAIDASCYITVGYKAE